MWCFSFHVFLLHLFCSLLHPPLPFYKVFLFCLLPPFLSSSSFLCCIIACFLLLSPPIPHCFLHLTSPHLFFLLTPLSHSFPHLSFLSPSPLPSLPPPPPPPPIFLHYSSPAVAAAAAVVVDGLRRYFCGARQT